MQKANEDSSPVAPWILGLFVFVVCGSGKSRNKFYLILNCHSNPVFCFPLQQLFSKLSRASVWLEHTNWHGNCICLHNKTGYTRVKMKKSIYNCIILLLYVGWNLRYLYADLWYNKNKVKYTFYGNYQINPIITRIDNIWNKNMVEWMFWNILPYNWN